MQTPDVVAHEVRRACLELEARYPGVRTLMFTAPVGGEGTTTVACVCARVLAAMSNSRVVLVDANLDAPGVHARMGVAAAPGLRDWDPEQPARGIATLADEPRVAVLPDGSANGVSLYGLETSGRLGQLARLLRQDFAYVLWDAPALNLHPQARFLLPHVDGVLAVLEADATRLEALAEFGNVVAKSGAPLLGAIMNRGGRYSFDTRSSGIRSSGTGLRPVSS